MNKTRSISEIAVPELTTILIEEKASRSKNARVKQSTIIVSEDYRPNDDEPFMNPVQQEYFKNKLIAWKEDIIRQTRETIEGLNTEVTQHADLTDRATSETDRALELRARDRQRKLVG